MSAGLTTEEAREFARRWAWWHAEKLRRPDGSWQVISMGPPPLLDAERERLFAWVRERMASYLDSCKSSVGREREFIADHVGEALGLSKGDGSKATATAWAICEAAGWPA